ncbi:unnamed protein product [Trifolium pratense]|uniref:Uncharacterized protein n=1 Tax=Trifolium pratense TaxID=57577 RepID=A0ACB0IPY3_TRIPR|nr:unnamed protein product [Trifolium pratense]
MDRLKSRIPEVPYDLMFPYLIYDHPDKAKELQALFDKYKRDEIPKYVFVRLLVEIVGDDQQVLSAAIQMRKKRILPLTVNEQSKTQISSRLPVMPYDQMFPFLFPEIHNDKAKEIQALFDKYKRGEIPKYDFVSLMKGIAGEEKLKSAEAKLKQQKRYLPVTVNEQPRTQINFTMPVMPYDQMFPFLFPEIHNDKAKEIQALFDKYKRGEIPNYDFVSLMKGIAGEEKLKSAEAKLKQQKRYLPVTVNEQPRTQINFTMPVVPYDQMFPFLFHEIDQDKASELKDLFDKYKRDEIPRNTFYSLMKDIVGEELLLSASEKLQQVNELFRTQISFSLPVVPYDQMFPFLFPEIHKDKANEIQASFDKYKRGEIPKYDFVSFMKGIVGEEKLRSVEAILKQQRGQIGEHTFVPFMKGILGEQMLRSAKVKQRKRSQLFPDNKQPRTQINSSKLVLPFDQLIPLFISHIDPDKAIELEVFFDKYKRGEIPQYTFVSVMKGILGEQMLRIVTEKVKRQNITNTGSYGTSL